MAKYPIMVEYSYDLKENLARRTIALFIDLFIVGIPVFILYVFFGLGVLQANPMTVLLGLIGPFFYKQQVQGVQETTPFLSMLVMVIFQSFLLPIYYSWRESNSRRTVGKYLMHLDPIRKDGMFPTRWDALQRNYIKYIAGALGAYTFGILGWFLFIGVASLIDLKVAPEYKLDIRQRITEVPFGTAVLVEDPKVGLGKISIDGGKWAKLKDKEKKAKKFAKRLKKEEKATHKMEIVNTKSAIKKEKIRETLGKSHEKNLSLIHEAEEEVKSDHHEKKGHTLLGTPSKPKKEKVLLGKEKDEDEIEEDLEIDLSSEPETEKKAEGMELSAPKKIEKKQEQEEEAPEEEKEEKVSFFKKLFGGFGKKHEAETEEKKETTILGSGLPSLKKDAKKDETILQFMMDFDIDEKRAEGLYGMGYRRKEDLIDAIPQDLMIIEGMNPTIAKRIISRASK